MAQDQKENSGFSLPAPSNGASEAAPASTTGGTQITISAGNPATDTSSRDLLIGGGILLVLLIAIFFAKNAYANSLVAKRVPPNKANASGWWLFVLLGSIATGVVLAAVNSSKFMAPLILGPVAVVALVSAVLTVVSGRK